MSTIQIRGPVIGVRFDHGDEALLLTNDEFFFHNTIENYQ